MVPDAAEALGTGDPTAAFSCKSTATASLTWRTVVALLSSGVSGSVSCGESGIIILDMIGPGRASPGCCAALSMQHRVAHKLRALTFNLQAVRGQPKPSCVQKKQRSNRATRIRQAVWRLGCQASSTLGGPSGPSGVTKRGSQHHDCAYEFLAEIKFFLTAVNCDAPRNLTQTGCTFHFVMLS